MSELKTFTAVVSYTTVERAEFKEIDARSESDAKEIAYKWFRRSYHPRFDICNIEVKVEQQSKGTGE